MTCDWLVHQREAACLADPAEGLERSPVLPDHGGSARNQTRDMSIEADVPRPDQAVVSEVDSGAAEPEPLERRAALARSRRARARRPPLLPAGAHVPGPSLGSRGAPRRRARPRGA